MHAFAGSGPISAMRVLPHLLVPLALFALSSGAARQAQEADKKARDWLKAGPPEKCVDVLFVGDGYQKGHFDKFTKDVDRYATHLLKQPPFEWYKGQINVRSLFVASTDKGCDEAVGVEKVHTAFESCFDSPTGRLLVFTDEKSLAQAIESAGPTDIAFVMVNTERYGGAGTVLSSIVVRDRPLPAPTFSAQDTTSFQIAIHELGHSFAQLADEYEDPLVAPSKPLPAEGKDLAEANVTLSKCCDPTSFETLRATVKWKHFLDLPGAKKHKWAHDGGFYRPKGILHPWPRCMMNRLGEKFCPICMEEMSKAIVATCGGTWDDAEYHKKHPLSGW